MESTLKAILISIFLTVILAASNTYLALKIGILPSASIPAAILAMGILRLFKNNNILENNLIQTAASAGQAVVGGIVYTAPSLIMIHYWHSFPYWQCFTLSFIGGSLGVLLSIPLRKKLVSDPTLPFPEGKAIAAVLQASAQGSINLRKIITGAGIGAALDLFQSGFKILAEDFQYWVIKGTHIFGFGMGFSTAMIGTGYLIGINIGASLLIGGILGWIVGMPLLSDLLGFSAIGTASDIAMNFWNSKLRFISIGSMLFAGLFSLVIYVKPFIAKSLLLLRSLYDSQKNNKRFEPVCDLLSQRDPQNDISGHKILKSAKLKGDLPTSIVSVGIFLCLVALFVLFFTIFNFDLLQISSLQALLIILFFLTIILIFGFIFSAICGYFSGLLGVSGSPGSGIIVSGALIIAVLLKTYLNIALNIHFTDAMLLETEAIIITITAILACIAAISCDNIQDLKVGHIIGATPWKQQLMLLMGIFIVSVITPFIMQLLLGVYGISGDLTHHLDPSQVLTAPPAAMIASLVDAIFKDTISWGLIGSGAFFVLFLLMLNYFFNRNRIQFSILAIATGMYLPLSTTVPLFVGSLIAELIHHRLSSDQQLSVSAKESKIQSGFLIASGMLCGATVMQVILAGIFSIWHNSEILTIMPKHMHGISALLSIITTSILCYWIYKTTISKKYL